MPALDGLRGIAILWVMLFHMAVVPAVGPAAQAWREFSASGGLGVDIFFVLSGFLITGILLDTKNSPQYFRNFYARRILRIFPLYYAVVFASLVILPHITQFHATKFHEAIQHPLWYWLHLSNFAIARRGAFAHGILDVAWSLAIEEQFYLIWPLIVLSTSARTLRSVCVVLIAVSCISRAVLTAASVNPVAVYTLTFCRLDGLCIGALTALCVRALSSTELRRLLPSVSGAAIVLVGLTLASTRSSTFKLFSVGLTYTAVGLLAACAIIGVLALTSQALVTTLSVTPLRVLGRFSYAMYLFHYPVMAALRELLLKRSNAFIVLGSSLPSQLGFDLISIAATLLAALVSWHAYEKWLLALKRHF